MIKSRPYPSFIDVIFEKKNKKKEKENVSPDKPFN